ncbi:MAG: indolepyruvate oxidoreductase subunit beta family protein [Dehalococcoidia bacterium]|nr:indolepyruvate oxidoreductase subunit beta family protein [Dehalococcoidia bacterium]
MAEAGPKIKRVYIVAVGGQGSAVLADWLFNAAQQAGYTAQTVGLPGLSQRGGSTSYYMEVLLGMEPDRPDADDVVFCHHPVPGEVDIILAQEFLELGRALQRGFASPSTAVIASTHRVYSLVEKVPASGGVAGDEDIRRLVAELTGHFTGFDALALARKNGLEEVAVNAILLGAVSASEVLPIGEGVYREAIRRTGVAVEANLSAFDLGCKHVTRKETSDDGVTPRRRDDCIQDLSARLPARRRRGFISLATSEVAEYDPRVQDTLVEACYLLTDYQDLAYAAGFLGAVKEIYSADSKDQGYELSRLFAAGLASLMSYEDVIQVARFKTSQRRFAGIRENMGIQEEQAYGVTDYFSPEVDEVLSVLPSALYRPRAALLRWLGWGGAVLRYRSPTTSLPGFLLLRLMTGMRRWRRRSQRYRREAEMWRYYQEAVAEFVRLDYDLGCLTARSAQMVKGYGAIRRRHVEALRLFLEEMLRPLTDREMAVGTGGFPLTLRVGRQACGLILGGEGGLERAQGLVAGVLRDLHDEKGYKAALRRLSTTTVATQ